MNDSPTFSSYQNLSFEKFKERARNPSLSDCEKVGFPEIYRRGLEEFILADILSKLAILGATTHKTVLEIGPGSSKLARLFIAECEIRHHKLILIDSEEMLEQLPEAPHLVKIGGKFPRDCADFVSEFKGRVDSLLVYSVFHYIFAEGIHKEFVSSCLKLLARDAEFLLGDLPNFSKKLRFMSSEAGRAYHRATFKTPVPPLPPEGLQEKGSFTDEMLLDWIAYFRNSGFEAYLLPQPNNLPLSTRRDDILVRRLNTVPT